MQDTVSAINNLLSKRDNYRAGAIEALDLLRADTVEAPTGYKFLVVVDAGQEKLHIERCNTEELWVDDCTPGSRPYDSVVRHLDYDSATIADVLVDSIVFDAESHQMWGYNTEHGVRVLITPEFAVELTEVE